MKVIVKFGDIIKEFDNQDIILIGNNSECDFMIPEMLPTENLKMVYAEKYNNYVLMNISQTRDIHYNDKVFSKVLVNQQFRITTPKLTQPLEIEVQTEDLNQIAPSSSYNLPLSCSVL